MSAAAEPARKKRHPGRKRATGGAGGLAGALLARSGGDVPFAGAGLAAFFLFGTDNRSENLPGCGFGLTVDVAPERFGHSLR